MFVLAALMKTVNICQSTAKIGTFVIHLLSVRGNSEALRTALIRWKRQQMFSHCFLFQLSKLQLDASNIVCGFLHFKASELLGLWQGKFCPQILASTALMLQPKCWEWKQDATGGMARMTPWHTAAPGYTLAEQDPRLLLQHKEVYPFSSFRKVDISEEVGSSKQKEKL